MTCLIVCTKLVLQIFFATSPISKYTLVCVPNGRRSGGEGRMKFSQSAVAILQHNDIKTVRTLNQVNPVRKCRHSQPAQNVVQLAQVHVFSIKQSVQFCFSSHSNAMCFSKIFSCIKKNKNTTVKSMYILQQIQFLSTFLVDPVFIQFQFNNIIYNPPKKDLQWGTQYLCKYVIFIFYMQHLCSIYYYFL